MKRIQIEHLPPILILFAIVFLFFYRTMNFELLSWDDYELIKWNESLRGFSWQHLKVWLTTPHLNSYIPVTLGSFALDILLWGEKTQSYRFTNLLLHFLNSCFVYFLLFRITKMKRLALLLTALFILHPVQVESVLWVSQRKTLLFSFFFLLGFVFMLRLEEATSTQKKWRYFFFPFLCFILAVMSKPTAAGLIFILPIYFLLHQSKRNVFLKPLYFVLLFLIVYITFLSFSLFPNILKDNFSESFAHFILRRMFALTVYLKELFVPQTSGLYRIPYHLDFNSTTMYLMLFLCYGGLCFCLYAWRKNRELWFWSSWSFIWLLPVVNIFVAPYGDRHLYLPIIGILALLGFFLRNHAKLGIALLFLSFTVLVPMSHARFDIWRNSERFLKEMLSVRPNDYDASMSLAGFYEDHGMKDNAREIYWKQMMHGHSHLPYAFLNCYNLLLHSDPKDERLIRITRRHFRKKYGMELREVYQRLLIAKKNRKSINPIIDELISKVQS